MIRTLYFVGVSDLLLSDLPAGRAPRMATWSSVLLLPADMALSTASINSRADVQYLNIMTAGEP